MDGSIPTATTKATESLAEKHARLTQAREAKRNELATKRMERDVKRLELIERFESELGGDEGSEFFVYDSGHLDDPLFVVKRGLLVQFTKYSESKQTPTDRYDFVAPSVVYPSQEEYKRARENRVGIEIELSNRLAKLFGLKIAIDEGK